MPRKKSRSSKPGRRVFTKMCKCEAVQMLGDGYSASSVADRLRLYRCPKVLDYRLVRKFVTDFTKGSSEKLF